MALSPTLLPIHARLNSCLQALRRELGHSLEEHNDYVARICEGMTEVAARPENADHAWFPQRQSAEAIKTPSDDNRFIGFPYTKKMNSMLCKRKHATTSRFRGLRRS